MRTITIENTVGNEHEKAVHTPLTDTVLFFTQYPALLLILLASTIAFIGEQLLLGTHHVELRCTPKE